MFLLGCCTTLIVQCLIVLLNRKKVDKLLYAIIRNLQYENDSDFESDEAEDYDRRREAIVSYGALRRRLLPATLSLLVALVFLVLVGLLLEFDGAFEAFIGYI